MAQHYLSYWKPTTEKSDLAGPLDHAASNQYKDLKLHSTVWIVTVKNGGKLILKGRVVVDVKTDKAGARKRLRTSNVWDAKVHIFADSRNAEIHDEVDISDLAGALRFVSKKDRLVIEAGKVNAQQLQSMRKLTIESVSLLSQRWTGDSTQSIEDSQEVEIKGRSDIGSTEKMQLIKSRRGQGIFRVNVMLNEQCCRVTNVSDPKHLRASHIKPWKDSSDEEKLNGCNGLLLAPHVDHLFDKGMISFGDLGELLVSSHLQAGILKAWGIPRKLNVGEFNSEQAKFLAYHRKAVLVG